MATLTFTVCDECRKETKRLIRIDHSHYCCRDCYLAACKRLFDLHWLAMLEDSSSDERIHKTKRNLSRVA